MLNANQKYGTLKYLSKLCQSSILVGKKESKRGKCYAKPQQRKKKEMFIPKRITTRTFYD